MVSASAEGLQRTVIDAAVAIAATSGPDDVSLREVARRAGVSHQAPYHHFKDREGLFAAICQEGFSRLADAIKESGAASREAMCLAYVRFALDNKGHFRVMFRSDICNLEHYPEALVEADRAFGALADYVVEELGPRASVEEVRLNATYMWSIAHGLAMLLLDGPLEKKIGPVTDVDEFVMNVARLATRQP